MTRTSTCRWSWWARASPKGRSRRSCRTSTWRPPSPRLPASTSGLIPDGHSLVPLLDGTVARWGKVALVEHHGPPNDPSDPDNKHQELLIGIANPPDYEALRSADYLYVDNQFSSLSPATKKSLH